MLVLSRKNGEKVRIKLPDGRLVWLTVVEIRGDKVRLGVTAPPDLPVHRLEVWERMQTNDEPLTPDMESA